MPPALLSAHGGPPSSTYRLQFTPDFTFADAEAIVDYLEALGVGALYASPLLEAVPEPADLSEAAWLLDWEGKLLRTVMTESRNTSGMGVGDGYIWMVANAAPNGVFQTDMNSRTVSHRQIPLGGGGSLLGDTDLLGLDLGLVADEAEVDVPERLPAGHGERDPRVERVERHVGPPLGLRSRGRSRQRHLLLDDRGLVAVDLAEDGRQLLVQHPGDRCFAVPGQRVFEVPPLVVLRGSVVGRVVLRRSRTVVGFRRVARRAGRLLRCSRRSPTARSRWRC